MMDETIEFGSLLCSKLCHDLMSPVAGINNGLEMLADEKDPAMRQELLQMITSGAAASADKLLFFRLAFGAAGGFGEQIDTREARKAVDALLREKPKVALGWLVDEPALPRGAMRILLNLALIALDALVRGGRLDIGVEAGEIVIRAEGPRLALDPAIAAVLRGDSAEPLAPRTSGAALVAALAGREGRAVRVAQQDTVLLIGVGAAQDLAAS